MKAAKIWMPIAVVAVAVAAFVLGSQFYAGEKPIAEDEVAASEEPVPPAPPAPIVEEPEPAPAPPPAARPARRRRTAPPARPAPPPEPKPVREAAPPPEPVQETPRTPPPPPQPVKVRLAEGTKIHFRLDDTLTTEKNQAGDIFTGTVSRPVVVDNKVVVPEGSVVRGRIAQAKRAGRFRGRAEMDLRLEELELPDGQFFALVGTLTDAGPDEKEKVTEEGTIEGEGSKKRDAATIGAGGGIGAAIGAIAGGGKGAAAGAGVGAAAGTAAVLLTRGKDVEIRAGSEMALQLDRAIEVQVK